MSLEAIDVAILPIRQVDERQIEAALERAATELAPDVVRIRYSLEEDWIGAESIYFRVLLRDGLGYGEKLFLLTQRVQEIVRERVQPEEKGTPTLFRLPHHLGAGNAQR